MAMTAWQKQAETSLLKDEAEAMKAIEKAHKQAMKDIKAEIKRLSEKEQTPSVIYQKKYQEALLSQVSGTIDKMHDSQYATMKDYLDGCYEGGYIASMYDIANQGIPVMAPIDQAQVVKAVLTDSKLSKPMYQAMGKYLTPLKKAVSQEISRGLAQSMHWNEIGAMVERRANIGLYNAQRIARTEGHRIQNAAKMDAMNAAKGEGADVVKQWDSTMDGRTRPHHRQLDGQIRELDEPFEVAGRKAMHPGNFGVASEDIQCRCVMLERARWALDDSELDALKEKAEYWGIDKTKDFNDYQAKYKAYLENEKAAKEQAEKIAKANAELAELDKTFEIAPGFKLKPSQHVSKETYAKAQKFISTTTADISYSQFWKNWDAYYEQYKKYSAKKGVATAAKAKLGETVSKAAKKSPVVKAKHDAVKKQAEKAKPKTSGFMRFDTGMDSYRHYISHVKDVWSRLTKSQKTVLTRYTGNYYREMNHALRYGEFNPKGRKKVDKAIKEATEAIRQSVLEDDVHARRGVAPGLFMRMVGLPQDTRITRDIADSLIGKVAKDDAFMSCGAASGTGFSGLNLEIDIPKGSQAIFAEPFSNFGRTPKYDVGDGGEPIWDGKTETNSTGGECEILLQRGSHFRIDGFDWDGDRLTAIHLTLVEQRY